MAMSTFIMQFSQIVNKSVKLVVMALGMTARNLSLRKCITLGFVLLGILLVGYGVAERKTEGNLGVYTGVIVIALGCVGYLVLASIAEEADDASFAAKHVTSKLDGAFKILSQSGIDKTYDNITQFIAEYDSIVGNANRTISILSTGQSAFRWNPDFRRTTIAAIRRGVGIRVLLVSPRSTIVKKMAGAGTMNVRSLRIDLERSINDWASLATDLAMPHEEQLSVRVYEQIPALFLFIVDGTVFFSPFLGLGATYMSPCFRLSGGHSSIRQSFEQHFERMWYTSATYLNDEE